jgi:hypothetical protein
VGSATVRQMRVSQTKMKSSLDMLFLSLSDEPSDKPHQTRRNKTNHRSKQ